MALSQRLDDRVARERQGLKKPEPLEARECLRLEAEVTSALIQRGRAWQPALQQGSPVRGHRLVRAEQIERVKRANRCGPAGIAQGSALDRRNPLDAVARGVGNGVAVGQGLEQPDPLDFGLADPLADLLRCELDKLALDALASGLTGGPQHPQRVPGELVPQGLTEGLAGSPPQSERKAKSSCPARRSASIRCIANRWSMPGSRPISLSSATRARRASGSSASISRDT
jgi:hypothetical protein